MKDYCTDTKACRHALLLAYFGERFAAGRCDNCCDNCVARQQGAVLLDDGIWLVSGPLSDICCFGMFLIAILAHRVTARLLPSTSG